MSNRIECRLVSSMTKVFADAAPAPLTGGLTVLQGEPAAVQVAYTATALDGTFAAVTLASLPAADIRQVGLVPTTLTQWPNVDDGYLRTAPGLFPDPLVAGQLRAYRGQWRAAWLRLDTTYLPAGQHRWRIAVRTEDAEPQALCVDLTVVAAQAKAPVLWHTEWFHVDALAHYYHLTPYEPALWARIREFVAFAVARCGVNTLLTPLITPPLDTAEGTRRLNVQLVAVAEPAPGRFTFDFAALRRWCALCRELGVANLELPPLFSQWGAKSAANVQVDGRWRFGWATPATDPDYVAFWHQLLPAARAVFAEYGYDNAHLFYHVSDEPGQDARAQYAAARAGVADLFTGCTVMDAVSDLGLYQAGLVQLPVVADDALAPFLAAGVQKMWTYYCCAQGDRVPNRFFALPSFRNRVMGVLLYVTGIQGFLHWGYNFYSAALSTHPIDPYAVTDADGFFPGGDPFLVYPSQNGPVSSIRNEVQMMGLADLALLQQLEAKIGRSAVLALVAATAGGALSFTDFPQNAVWLDRLHALAATRLADA
ncbi:DUF4091 domain-containing protein [Lacticaseibacillus kribbianus]|uniref:DUF4091 domain-containing protein n=1 Tax=Lacticaseibacillus kribbianus TaxID=2926292 RepID=UPI001CD66472|nr:DUF4091 domain-containing protein [Lacticaseibacillus kribbianus]